VLPLGSWSRSWRSALSSPGVLNHRGRAFGGQVGTGHVRPEGRNFGRIGSHSGEVSLRFALGFAFDAWQLRSERLRLSLWRELWPSG
jgi:hypothetical protein